MRSSRSPCLPSRGADLTGRGYDAIVGEFRLDIAAPVLLLPNGAAQLALRGAQRFNQSRGRADSPR